jgi:succinylarginine dihydrolase
MSSYSTRFDGQSTITAVGGSTGGSSLLGDVARLRLVRDVVSESPAAVAAAAAAIERVEEEIDHLWFDSMKAEDLAMSQLLAEVSHALQRAARLLEADNAIG